MCQVFNKQSPRFLRSPVFLTWFHYYYSFVCLLVIMLAFYLYQVNRNYRALIPSTRFLLNLYNKKGVKRKKKLTSPRFGAAAASTAVIKIVPGRSTPNFESY